jgi:hypothetical protein
MKSINKKFLVIGITAALAGSLMGCGQEKKETTVLTTSNTAPVGTTIPAEKANSSIGSIENIDVEQLAASSTIADVTIHYIKNGNKKSKKFTIEYGGNKDLDHDGIPEIITESKLWIFDPKDYPNAAQPEWFDVYSFDFETEDLVIKSSKYPDYYKEEVIPKLQEIVNNNTMSDLVGVHEVEQQLVRAAEAVVSGELIPTHGGTEVYNFVTSALKVIQVKDQRLSVSGLRLGMSQSEVKSMLGIPSNSGIDPEDDEPFDEYENYILNYYNDHVTSIHVKSIDTKLLKGTEEIKGIALYKSVDTTYYYFDPSRELVMLRDNTLTLCNADGNFYINIDQGQIAAINNEAKALHDLFERHQKEVAPK